MVFNLIIVHLLKSFSSPCRHLSPGQIVGAHSCVQMSPLTATPHKQDHVSFFLPGRRVVETLSLASQENLLATFVPACLLMSQRYVKFYHSLTEESTMKPKPEPII